MLHNMYGSRSILVVFATALASCAPDPTPTPDAGEPPFDAGLDAAADAGADAEADAGPPACARGAPPWGRAADLMLPGTDCVTCHQVGGSANDFPFVVAGTVFRSSDCAEPTEGALVHVLDATGAALTLTANAYGNFYSNAPLVMPLEVSVELDGRTSVMEGPAESGSCGECHNPASGVPGWVHVAAP